MNKGQKSEYYDYSKLVRNKNVPEPAKQLLIVFDHYTVASDDEGDVVLNPEWKEGDKPEFKYMKGVSKADTWYGNTTLGQKDMLKISKTYKPTEIEIEEGDFTPTIGSLSLAAATGKYTK